MQEAQSKINAEDTLIKTAFIQAISKLPRFFHAKVIELVDKLSSNLVFFSLGMALSFQGLFDHENVSQNMQTHLKDSKYFKAWHREVEDTLDDLTEKIKEFFEKLASLSYKESRNDDQVKKIMDSIAHPSFYNHLNFNMSKIGDNKNYLGSGLHEIANILKNQQELGLDGMEEPYGK